MTSDLLAAQSFEERATKQADATRAYVSILPAFAFSDILTDQRHGNGHRERPHCRGVRRIEGAVCAAGCRHLPAVPAQPFAAEPAADFEEAVAVETAIFPVEPDAATVAAALDAHTRGGCPGTEITAPTASPETVDQEVATAAPTITPETAAPGSGSPTAPTPPPKVAPATKGPLDQPVGHGGGPTAEPPAPTDIVAANPGPWLEQPRMVPPSHEGLTVHAEPVVRAGSATGPAKTAS